METADVVVIGAGVIGLSVAHALTERGVAEVMVLEKESLPGTGSTAACTGGIRLQFSSTIHVLLSLHGLRKMPLLAERYGVDIGLRRTGYLFLISSAERKEHYAAGHAAQARAGVRSDFVDAEWVAKRAPFLELDEVLCASYCDSEAHADPAAVVQAYTRGLRERGLVISTHTTVTRIKTVGDTVTGVETSRGLISTNTVVICAGPYSAQVARSAGSALPLTPRRRHVVVVKPPFGMDPDLPLIVDDNSGWYILGEPGGICLVGGTDREGTISLTSDEETETVDRILRVSVDRAPDLADAGLVNTIVGLRTMSPDDHALIGEVPNVAGLYCACGFSGHGFMHAPGAGEALAALITTGHSEEIDLSPFDPGRFTESSPSHAPETHVF